MSSSHGNDEKDCTIPKAIPAELLNQYVLERDEFAERDIADYVEGQSRRDGDRVVHVERIKTEVVLGVKHEIWDVTTEQDRFWVLTNPTNLYSQKHFPSLDYLLSFHVGLMARVRSRTKTEGTMRTPFDEVMRRLEQAHDALDHAVESEEFQAVGMSLREALISLAAAGRRRIETPDLTERPKDGDFKGWTDAFFDQLLPGEAHKAMRRFFKITAKEAWDLVSWLTHAQNATHTAASIALQATENFSYQFVEQVERGATGNQERCPACNSFSLRTHFDYGLGEQGEYFQSCGKCRWHNHPGRDDDKDMARDE